MSAKEVWFSHREEIYEVKKGEFNWTKEYKRWNWDHCTIDLVKNLKGQLMVIVRSQTNKNSTRMGNKPVKIRFMLGLELVNDFSPPEIKTPKDWPGDICVIEFKGRPSSKVKERDYWIWDWVENEKNIKDLYNKLAKKKSSSSGKIFNVPDINESRDGSVIPVIYQPAVDSLKNFLREIHWNVIDSNANQDKIEVTLIFNDEELRKNFLLDPIYRGIRKRRYGRTHDVETFHIVLNKKDPEHSTFIFKNIYSSDNNVEKDDVHGDWAIEKQHDIKYFFKSFKHPVVFINTSNHAMAAGDENNRLWKWEYVPWENDGPVKIGDKEGKRLTRDEIDAEDYKEAKFKRLHPLYDKLMDLVNNKKYGKRKP